MRVIPFAVVLACTAVSLAQRPVPTGTVTGHVVCDDTHLPARFASVVLQPAVDLNSPALRPDGRDTKPEPSTTIVQTLLDGSFTIPDVRPGDYYVIAEKTGYLSPLAQLSRADLNRPTEATARLMAALLTPVSVAANRTASAEVHLLRGASISGTIRFDDGTAAAASPVNLLHKDKSGKWVAFRTALLAGLFGRYGTDDLGHFRFSGLPAGEYLLRTSLEINDIIVNHIFNEGGGTSSNTRYELNIFNGNVFRQRDAKLIKLSEGEDSAGNDIEVPLTKLHAINGSILEGASGRTVNAAKVAILYPDDSSQLVSTSVSKEDDAFHLLYVPEGEYTLKVTEARDVTRTEVPNCAGCTPPSHTEEKIIRTFGDAQQPLTLQTDMTALTVTVPPKPSATTATSPAQ